MANGYARNPQGPERLAARIRAIEKRQNQLDAALKGLGITVDPETGQLVVPSGRSIVLSGGDLDVESGNINLDGGDLIATGGNVKSGNFVAGSTGYRLRANGNVELNDLTLRGGIIGNDALANPVTAAAVHNQSSGFSLTTTAVAKCTATFTVPTGFTKALVMASISATAVNKAATVDFFDGYADINAGGSFGGFDAASDGEPGDAIGIAHTSTALLTSLGGTFTVRAMLRSGSNNWAADAFNSANIDALAVFLR